ncbi:MAG: RDD family protein [Ferruginibacter sp.]
MQNTPTPTEQNSQVDYLASLDEPFFQMVHATTGQRFLNYLIDNILMNYGLGYFTGTIIGVILAAISPDFLAETQIAGNYWSIILLSLAIGYFNYLIYYTLCEKLLRGRTIGKLITGTRAVRADGSELTLKDAILRSVCRIVPFEQFSAFGGHPWHDRWTNTIVIKSR